MGQYSSYYLYQKYEKIGSQDWVPCTPNVFSISGDSSNPMPIVMKEENDPNCGYVDAMYRWVNLDPNVTWICVSTTKYYKQQKQVSYDSGATWISLQEYQQGAFIEADSTDCGYSPSIIYRWIELPTGGTNYYCVGYDKYTKEKKQQSSDSGATWVDTNPIVYRAGSTLIESASTDCGYVEPIYAWREVNGYVCDDCVDTKLSVGVSANTYVLPCSTAKTVTSNEVASLTSKTSIAWCVISSCADAIGDAAFVGCSAMEFCRIPNTVKTIGEQAFYGCSAMTECSLPSGMQSIGTSAFTNSISLAFINLPNGITSIGSCAFKNCLNFRYINIPDSITSIPIECFYNCDGLSDIELHDGITSIGQEAFRDCQSLYSVVCNATTPPTLGTNAFTNTNSDLKIYVPSSSVDTYKAASGWSTYANKIYAIQ